MLSRPVEGSPLLSSRDEYLQPISPLRDKKEMGRYLPIARVDEMFTSFKSVFDDAVAWTDYGHLFVMMGEKGYGKTSHIQRCAAWLETESGRRKYCRIVTVDLSDSRWTRKPAGEPLTLNERMYRTLDRVLRKLETLNLLEIGMRTDIITRYGPELCQDCSEGFHELGEILDSYRDSSGLRVVISVLLEGYPTPGEVFAYYNAAEKGMIFFAELFEQRDIDRMVQDWPGLNRVSVFPHRILLDKLKPGDFRLISHWIMSHERSWPVIPESVIDYVEDEYIASDTGAGVIELIKLVQGALKVARAARASQVTNDHIIQYYRMQSRQSAV